MEQNAELTAWLKDVCMAYETGIDPPDGFSFSDYMPPQGRTRGVALTIDNGDLRLIACQLEPGDPADSICLGTASIGDLAEFAESPQPGPFGIQLEGRGDQINTVGALLAVNLGWAFQSAPTIVAADADSWSMGGGGYPGLFQFAFRGDPPDPRMVLLPQGSVTAAPQADPPQSDVNLWGVYPDPPLLVGDGVGLTAGDRVHGLTLYEKVRSTPESPAGTVLLGDELVHVTNRGQILTSSNDPIARIRLTNLVTCAISEFGFEATPVRGGDFWTYHNASLEPHFTWTGASGTGERNGLWITPVRFELITRPRCQVISLDVLLGVLARAERLSRNTDHYQRSLYALESNTLQRSRQYRESFLLLWFAVENWLVEQSSNLWIDRGGSNKSLKDKDWTASHMSDLLFVSGRLDKRRYDDVTRYRGRRNKVVHSGDDASAADCSGLRDLVRHLDGVSVYPPAPKVLL